MIVFLRNILSAVQAQAVVTELSGASGSDAAREGTWRRHGDTIAAALMSSKPFVNAILPKALTSFEFAFSAPGSPGSSRLSAPLTRLGGPDMLRIDAMCAVFLSDPAGYEGGGLTIDTSTAPAPVRLSTGDAVVFPATDYYEVNPVTRGGSWIGICGVQSVVRGVREREILAELWMTLEHFETMNDPGFQGENDGSKILGKARSNLIRILAET